MLRVKESQDFSNLGSIHGIVDFNFIYPVSWVENNVESYQWGIVEGF